MLHGHSGVKHIREAGRRHRGRRPQRVGRGHRLGGERPRGARSGRARASGRGPALGRAHGARRDERRMRQRVSHDRGFALLAAAAARSARPRVVPSPPPAGASRFPRRRGRPVAEPRRDGRRAGGRWPPLPRADRAARAALATHRRHGAWPAAPAAASPGLGGFRGGCGGLGARLRSRALPPSRHARLVGRHRRALWTRSGPSWQQRLRAGAHHRRAPIRLARAARGSRCVVRGDGGSPARARRRGGGESPRGLAAGPAACPLRAFGHRPKGL